ncbi:MAG: class I SAM-dependent methyltransferase [Treponema sp.]|nr:class I SAM-dependent methyltransferase [Treponema sp.]
MTEKDSYQAEIFRNRIAKKFRELKKWARKNRITCFRIYDRDIPEVPLCLDIYELLPSDVTSPLECARFISMQNERQSANDKTVEAEIASRRYAVLYLYERPYEKEQSDEDQWLSLMAKQVSEVFNISENQIITKQRKKQKGIDNQYEKQETESLPPLTGLVQEQGQIFRVDLTSYIDTGLFFDHRPLRSIIRETCSGKSVLNLFCYTGSISVYAAGGNAKRVESVDLSNTYLSWAKENFNLNEYSDRNKYYFTKADCVQFLKDKQESEKPEDRYDIIILDPPTFSNSKMADTMDINRDWPELCKLCLNLLNKNGVLYFSTNSRRLKFDAGLLPESTASGFKVTAQDITQKTISQDFTGTNPHKAFEIRV